MPQLLVVKVGSQVLTHEEKLDHAMVGHIVADIQRCRSAGHRVILVSSGAVAAGRSELGHLMEGAGEVARRQVFAALGQTALMSVYRDAFQGQGVQCAQVLATKSDFRDRDHYLNMQRCLSALLQQGVIPIVNENDCVAVSELMFTDNDELAGLVASMMDADCLALLTSVDGVLVGDPPEVLPEWPAGEVTLAAGGFTKQGRGGVHTKIRIARQAAALGIECWIANGTSRRVLQQVVAGEAVGTRFPKHRKVSQVKRWVATSAGHERGVLTVNAGAAEALRNPERLSSVLPVGVVAIDGHFERGDILRVQAPDGSLVGLGKAQYGHLAARRHLGQRGAKAIIHYDYLYIEQ